MKNENKQTHIQQVNLPILVLNKHARECIAGRSNRPTTSGNRTQFFFCLLVRDKTKDKMEKRENKQPEQEDDEKVREKVVRMRNDLVFGSRCEDKTSSGRQQKAELLWMLQK